MKLGQNASEVLQITTVANWHHADVKIEALDFQNLAGLPKAISTLEEADLSIKILGSQLYEGVESSKRVGWETGDRHFHCPNRPLPIGFEPGPS